MAAFRKSLIVVGLCHLIYAFAMVSSLGGLLGLYHPPQAVMKLQNSSYASLAL